MAEVQLSISEPVSAMVTAVSRLLVALVEADVRRRETMSPEAKAEQDRIMAQMYWDWRSLLQRAGIVEEPKKP